MKIKSIPLAIMMAVLIFGGIALSSSQDWWQTEGRRSPQRFTTGDFIGQGDPSDIRGSYGFADVSSQFGIPIEILAQAFALPASMDLYNFQNKDLEDLYLDQLPQDVEIGNESVQLFVALYKGLPFVIAEDIYLPSSAVEILASLGTLSDEQAFYLQAHMIDMGNVLIADYPSQMDDYSQEEEHADDETVVRGSTTFYDLLNWGVSPSEIESVIQAKMPASGLLIRDFCSQNGLAFGLVKSELQLIVDKARAQ